MREIKKDNLAMFFTYKSIWEAQKEAAVGVGVRIKRNLLSET